ncbi:hypothetical protein C8Q79DRAFT_1013933 [Trametes meyenii]|nr:hypothetical protein C8Q79DRAFT_1013933 [Trametes meyenii]
MSSTEADTEAAQIIELYENVFPTNCMLWAVTTMLAYDYIITFNEEIKLFWSRKITGASVLFFIIRYAALLNYTILNPALSAKLSDVRWDHLVRLNCARLTQVQFIFATFQYIPWAAFSALRVLALSGMRWPLALLVFLLALGPSAVNFAAFKLIALTGANVLTVGCQGEDSATDLQGEIVLFVLNLASVVLTHLSVGEISQRASYITLFSEPLTAIFISRFLLDLQLASRGSTEVDTHTLNPSPDVEGSLRFAAAIATFGAAEPSDAALTDMDPDVDLSRRTHGKDVLAVCV